MQVVKIKTFVDTELIIVGDEEALCELHNIIHDAAEYRDNQGYHAIARVTYRYAEMIDNVLVECGFLDPLSDLDENDEEEEA